MLLDAAGSKHEIFLIQHKNTIILFEFTSFLISRNKFEQTN